MIDKTIDLFVEKINASDQEPLYEYEIPVFLRSDVQNELQQYYWQIKSKNLIDSAKSFQNKLSIKLPESFFSLISRYAFPCFEVTSIFFFANTGEDTIWELSENTFADKFMSDFLIKKGFIQFGNPDNGSYDPICFDTRQGLKKDYAIIQIDHENIICNSKIVIVKEIATSFTEFVKKYLL